MIKVGIIGFGYMGVTHAINILRSKKLELRAIVTSKSENIEKIITQSKGNIETGFVKPDNLKDVKSYTNMEECLKKEELDALHICVHTKYHYDQTKKALLNGKHVLLEKPMCLDVSQGKELIGLAKMNNLVLMVAHVVRFMPSYQLLKEWIDTKKYGNLDFLYLSRISGTPAWGAWKEPSVKKSSGGALFDLLIHDIDFMQYALGQPSKIENYNMPGNLSDYDYINSLWSFENLAVKGIIEGGNIFHSKFPFECRYKAKFKEASVEYSSKNPDCIVVGTDKMMEKVEVKGGLEKGYPNEIEYFADCLIKNQWPDICSPESSLRAIELCYMHI